MGPRFDGVGECIIFYLKQVMDKLEQPYVTGGCHASLKPVTPLMDTIFSALFVNKMKTLLKSTLCV